MPKETAKNEGKKEAITLTFPDGSKKEFPSGTIGKVVAESIGRRLAEAALAVKLDARLLDLSQPLTASGKFAVLTFDSAEGKEVFWHSGAHVLAQAVTKLYPQAKLTIGPVTEDGFYYDVDFGRSLVPEDVQKIEEAMVEVVKKDYPITREELPLVQAKKLFPKNKYKLELLDELSKQGEKTVSLYHQGDFFDLCRGPHVPSTGRIKAFKLTKFSAAYWRGDQQREQLQRIYGVAFQEKKQLEEYLKRIEEAEKRNHRKIIHDLDLAYFHEYAPGAPFFLTKGTIIYNTLIDFLRKEYQKRGYQEVITPQLYNKKLWEISGHWEHYKENMFIVKIEGQEHSLKPMNCPSHCLIYNRDMKSYKDLPIRIADFCSLHRNEFSGTLTGLVRVRKFSQDDGHIFCRFDQIEEEVLGVLNFIKYVWNDVFNFKLQYYLSTRPEKALGTKELWDKAEGILAHALQRAKIPYTIKAGDGAFYGPKIDIDIEDALGRKWQCPTCQLDFNLPERFNTQYIDTDGDKQTCVMIHRAILGSLERFFGIITEHYAGKFPLWLSPEQVRILTIADRHIDYAKSLAEKMKRQGIRAELDERNQTMNYKIREAQLKQVNYILVVGDKELAEQTANVRTRDGQVKGMQKADVFIKEIIQEIADKK